MEAGVTEVGDVKGSMRDRKHVFADTSLCLVQAIILRFCFLNYLSGREYVDQ